MDVLYKVLIALIIQTLCHFVTSISQGPPKLRFNSSMNETKIIRIGNTVSLECPVQKSRDDEIYFEWFKNGSPVEGFEQRLRITDSGHLKIKNSNSEDTGLFICKAINGFGSVEFSYTLIVLDGEESLHNPRLSEKIIKSTGSDVRLKCIVSANHKSSIVWYHNKQQLSESEPRKGRHSLVINDLKPEDSGNYTCLSTSPLGTIAQTFIIKVIDNLISEPKFEGNEPNNKTVALKGDVNLSCYINSEEFPRIQWLKKIDILSLTEEQKIESILDSSNYIRVMGELYKTLNSTQTIQISDTLFSNELSLNDVNEEDGGKYVCLAANKMGSTFSSAFLTVILPQNQKPTDIPIRRDLFDKFPVPLLIASVSVVLIIVFALIIWMSMCPITGSNTRIINRSYESAEKARSLSSDPNHIYNQIGCNQFINIAKSSSDGLRPNSPLYSEIKTNERNASNFYQLYKTSNDMNLKPNQLKMPQTFMR